MDANILGRFNCAVSLGASPEWISVEYAQKTEAEESPRQSALEQYQVKFTRFSGSCAKFAKYTLRSLGNTLWGPRKPTNSVRWYFLAPLNWIHLFSSKQRQKGNFGG